MIVNLFSSKSLVSRCTSLILAFLLVPACFSSAHAAEGARQIATHYDKVAVQGTPERVVVLSEAALDAAIALGVKPVASVATRGSTGVSDYLSKATGPISIVGTAREFNLEAILSAQPDLVLAPAGLSKELYAILSKLAPTIVPVADGFEDWRTNVRLYADALNKSDEAKQTLDALDERIAQLRTKLKPGLTASVVRWNPQGPLVMSSHVFTGQLLNQLGFSSKELAASLRARPHSDTLSLENLHNIDADWLFLATLNAEGQKTLDAARTQPAFNRLEVVKQGHVVSVDGQVWTSGTGPMAAEVILADIEKALIP